MNNRSVVSIFLGAALAVFAVVASAEITVGVTMGTTGPTAGAGLPYRTVFSRLPQTVAGQPVRYIILDDGGDSGVSVKNARKLITEDKVDIVMGSTSTPTCLSIVDAAVEHKVPQICWAPIVLPPGKQPWVFTVPQQLPVMVSAIVGHMKASGVKTIGYIGFTDGWGDLCWQVMEKLATAAGMKMVANERYNRTDASVTAQVLKIVAARPDAVFVGSIASPAVLPHVALKERGFKGNIYHTHGIIGPDFLRVGGKAVEGAIAPSGPLIVAAQLPDSNPIKKRALDFFKEFEPHYPQVRNAFAGYAWDTFLLFQAAVPGALAKAKPGTPEFRQAMRDSLESLKDVVGTHAIYNMSPKDHNGVDQRARVLVRVENGGFQLVK
jgi:branched-chain amino acid transport system substrate-binding protein